MGKEIKLQKQDLAYPELSYQIIGILFDVFNELGYQYQEKYYQRAIKELFLRSNITFQKLGILARFSSKGLKFKRIINFENS